MINVDDYKVVNGTYYTKETNDKVIEVLENARQNDKRIRVFYGDTKTGKYWLEEYDTVGTVGRSTGEIKVPLLINYTNSSGGGSILTDCIVAITINKQFVYKQENFEFPNFWLVSIMDLDMIKRGFVTGVNVSHDGITDERVANFTSNDKAMKYIQFMRGERNRK